MEHFLHISRSMNDYYSHRSYSLNTSSPGHLVQFPPALPFVWFFFLGKKLESPNSSNYIHCPASVCIVCFSTDDSPPPPPIVLPKNPNTEESAFRVSFDGPVGDYRCLMDL